MAVFCNTHRGKSLEGLERSLAIIRKSFFLLILLSTLCFQVFSQNALEDGNLLRFPLWALIDEVPSLEYQNDDSKQFFDFSVERLKELGPFVIEGMVYGWKFSYTPYDKKRNVAENFVYEKVAEIPKKDPSLKYGEVWLDNGRLNCWVQYARSKAMMQNYYAWLSVKNPKIHAQGKGKLISGIEGIKDAYAEAIKNAVRSYAQGLTKNKPKEITGTVLLTDYPRLIVQHGYYLADLSFYLEIADIRKYNYY